MLWRLCAILAVGNLLLAGLSFFENGRIPGVYTSIPGLADATQVTVDADLLNVRADASARRIIETNGVDLILLAKEPDTIGDLIHPVMKRTTLPVAILPDDTPPEQLDPATLALVQSRLDTIYVLARKHRVQPQQLLALQQKLDADLAAMDNSEERLQALEAQLKQQRDAYQKAADELSALRKKGARVPQPRS